MTPHAEGDYPPEVEALLKQLSPAQIHDLARRIPIERARRAAERKDILAWGQQVFPHKFPLPFCKDLHGYFVSIRNEVFTNTEAPRFHSKTTIKCFLIQIFQALEEPDTFNHYLNVQATDKKALAVNTAIRVELERNEMLHTLYGDQIGKDKWTDQQFVLKNGVIFTAASAGQSIRGLNYENIRPDYTVVDDLYNEEDINNPEATIKKNEWLMGTLYPAQAIGRRLSFHLQGTAINAVDAMEELKKNPDVKSRSFKAIIDEANRKALWPEGKSFEDLLKMRALMGSLIFNREMQNERKDDANSFIKRGWLYPEGGRSWEYDPAVVRFGAEIILIETRLGCDPSIGDKVENDYTGVVLVYKTKPRDGAGASFYIDAIWNEHLSLNERVLLLERIRAHQAKDRAINQAFIEGIAGFKDFVAEVKRRTSLPVREVDRVKDKISNLESKSHFFENRQVFLNKNIDPRLKDMLVHQLTTNHPLNDDIRDALFLTLDTPAAGWAWAN